MPRRVVVVRLRRKAIVGCDNVVAMDRIGGTCLGEGMVRQLSAIDI